MNIFSGIFSFMSRGGIVMPFIVLASIIAVAIIIERYIFLRKTLKNTNIFSQKIKDLMLEGNIEEIKFLCRNIDSPLARLVYYGIENRYKDKDELKEIMQTLGQKEILLLEKYIPTLGTIGGIAPLMGLLGTVFGMIQSTDVLGKLSASATNLDKLISGISQALLTTAAGLVVAIPVIVFYNYFVSKINLIISEMEIRSTEIIRILQSDRYKD